MSLALDFHFTEPASPLFINVDADDIETLFVISTTQVHNSEPTTVPNQARQRALANGGNDVAKKRMRDSETPTATPKFKKSVKVVRRTELPNHRQVPTTPSSSMGASANGKKKDKQPLFLPSQSDIAVEEGHDVNMTGPDMDGADAYGLEYEDQEVQMGDLNPPSEGEDMIFALSQAKAERVRMNTYLLCNSFAQFPGILYSRSSRFSTIRLHSQLLMRITPRCQSGAAFCQLTS